MITLIGNDSPFEIMNFPDGESFVKFSYNNKPINILWRYENDAEFMIIAQMFDVMKRVDPDARMPKNLLIPYLPHARQDRAAASNQPFSLEVVMVLLHSIISRADAKMYFLDAHSFEFANIEERISDSAYELGIGIFNTESIDSVKYATHLQNEGYDAIICPDDGARRRATLWHDAFLSRGHRIEFVQCTKVRDPNTGKLSDPQVENPVHRNRLINARKALLIDDIGTGFGTHIQLGKVIKQINPDLQIDLFVTHSSFTRGKDIVLEVFNKVYTTDSLPQGLTQVSDRIVRFDCTEFLPKV